jgi:hypothetical protein
MGKLAKCAFPGCKETSQQDLIAPQHGWIFQQGGDCPDGYYCPNHAEAMEYRICDWCDDEPAELIAFGARLCHLCATADSEEWRARCARPDEVPDFRKGGTA